MRLDAEMTQDDVIDLEWLQLMLVARNLGLTASQVRIFLQHGDMVGPLDEKPYNDSPDKATKRNMTSTELSEKNEP